jgi:hypothetical protein
MKRLLDWRAALVYLHRWFGIVGCLLFVSWFVSGIVLMYVRMPSLSAEERLSRIPPVDLTAARIEPAAAAFTAGFSPVTIRVSMLGGRPVYRFNAGSRWATVYADTGERLSALTAGEAAAVARDFVPEHATTLRYEASLPDADQWTLSAAMRPMMPLYRFGLGDSNGSTLYVSALTAEPVMKTTRRERLWNYAGAAVLYAAAAEYWALGRRGGLVVAGRMRLVSLRPRVGSVAVLTVGPVSPEAHADALSVCRHDEMAPLRRARLRIDDLHVDVQWPHVDDAVELEPWKLTDAAAARGRDRRSSTGRSGDARAAAWSIACALRGFHS